MHRLALTTLFLASSIAIADKKLPEQDARVELPDLVDKIATFGGKVIKIPGPLDVKPSTSYGCGFTRSKYEAVDVEDRGKHLTVYCLKTHKTLACGSQFKEPTRIMYALVRVPAKCKDTRAELLDY